MNETKESTGGAVSCKGRKTRDWYAWNNLMPPKPDDFHVVGEVLVPNPGVEALLLAHYPPGLNPQIILLDLVLIQRPGMWPQVEIWVPTRYDKVPSGAHEQAQILCDGDVIADVEVQDIH